MGKKIMVMRGLAILCLCMVSTISLFAAPRTEVPEATAQTEGTQYLSPNGDGLQEDGTISFVATLYVKSREGYIPEYGIRILNDSDETVREIVERKQSDLNWFIRLFTAYQEFALERTVTWDGTADDGEVVADGEYFVKIWVVDAQNRTVELSLDSFVIDTSAPDVEIVLQEPAVFSPNGDGNIESYAISLQNGSREDLWSGRIIDSSGDLVRSYSWQNGAPETIVWDGKSDADELHPDDIFTFIIESTDRSANSVSVQSGEFELSTLETPVAVTLSEIYISPNDDGVQDDVTISLLQDVTDGIVAWSLVIDDGEGTRFRRYEGSGPPPTEIVFDGYDDAGSVIPEDTYRALYSLQYRHGNKPFTTDLFAVDVTKPRIEVNVTRRLISPNGDGRNDDTGIWFRSNEKVTWNGGITNSSGDAIVQTSSDITTSLIMWRGADLEGNVVKDGVYSVNASFTDVAGNTYAIPTENIEVDLTFPVVTFGLDKDYFSPDDDGIKDTLTASFTSSEPVRGLLSLTDSAGRDVGTLGGLGRASQLVDGAFAYTWGGISGSGLYVPDGKYTVSSIYEDRAGNRIALENEQFVIDTRPVRVAASAPKGFSPNGDGRSDTITIGIDANFYDTVDEWTLDLIDAFGSTIRTISGVETLPREFTWDGSMQFADPQIKTSEGLYHARVRATYRKGNSVDVRTEPFFVDVTPPAISLKATADPFIQTEGAIEGDIYITLEIDDAHEIVDWSLDILNSENEIIRSFTGAGDLQDRIIWKDDGRRESQLPTVELVVLRVYVIDEVGNSATFEKQVPLDILVVRRDDKLYLMVPNIIFGEYQHELDSRSAEQFQKNLSSIDQVVGIYEKYPNYRLLLEGHALNVLLGDDEKAAKEEEILVPLTERRAQTVKSALTERGLDEDMIDTEWFGGSQPIVDVHDREIRWKNRRVEFIMRRPQE